MDILRVLDIQLTTTIINITSLWYQELVLLSEAIMGSAT